jgi:hypothetical protein
MAYFVIILSIAANFTIPRLFKIQGQDELRFISLVLLVALIWSIESLLTPEQCKCENDYLAIASGISLLIMYFLNRLNTKTTDGEK